MTSVANKHKESLSLRSLAFDVAYTDTAEKVLFLLPYGAAVVDVIVTVTTAFNDSGTDYLQVGVKGDSDAIVNDLDVSSAGRVALGAAFVDPWYICTNFNGVEIVAEYDGQNSDASAGAAKVVIVFAYKQGTTM